MDSSRQPGHGTTAVNRRNITHLRDQRDRAGLLQLANSATLSAHPDAPTVVADALEAVEWIDRTSPDTISADRADGIRVGDILTYMHAGHLVQGIALSIDGGRVTTNLGHTVTITG